MPNQNTKSIVKPCNIDDLIELNSSAYDSLANVSVLLHAIKNEKDKLAGYLDQAYGVPKEVLNKLERLINITHVMTNEDASYYFEESQNYSEKAEQLKGGTQ